MNGLRSGESFNQTGTAARMSETLAIVLAAGKGTRMKSDLPKVLVRVRGRAMIHYVIDALRDGGVDRIVVVVGYRAELVEQELQGADDVTFVSQTEQLGTGHAVKVCASEISRQSGAVLIVTGDSPLIQVSSVRALLDMYEHNRPACILGTADKADPSGLGRIVRDADNNFTGIVEEKDAADAERRITEVNMSTYVFDSPELIDALEQIKNDNLQGEYYLTDAPGILKAAHKDVRALTVLQPCEALSINNMEDLAVVEAEMEKLGYERAKDL
tara:strand:+ start:295 stop:1110 length:816 start_codon:yes stop_codon:yes gene_type:complete